MLANSYVTLQLPDSYLTVTQQLPYTACVYLKISAAHKNRFEVLVNIGLESCEWKKIQQPKGGEVSHEDLVEQCGEDGET